MASKINMDIGESEEFRLVKCIENEVWLAERLSDKETFIARRLEEFDAVPQKDKPAATTANAGLPAGAAETSKDSEEAQDAEGLAGLVGECGVGRALAQLLNHENLVSLAGVVSGMSDDDEKPSQTWLVWDFCDAGNLGQLFHDKEFAKQHTPKRYMPESLCWHVLRAVMRALVYLHDGARPYIEEDEGVEEAYMYPVDDDWHPVLHGAVTAENVFFQHPRGKEQYGLCKLGNFSGAFISGKVMPDVWDDVGLQAMGVVAGLQDGEIGPLDEIRKNLYSTRNPKANTRKAYTVKDELWSLGCLVFQMMAGTQPPPLDGCPTCNYECNHVQVCTEYALGCYPYAAGCACDFGGCPHTPKAACTHFKYPQECPHGHCARRAGVRFQDGLWRKHYSRYLIRAVLMLLQPGRAVHEWYLAGETGRIWEQHEELYRGFKEGTNRGLRFHGIEEELLERGLELERERERREEEEERVEKEREKKVWGDAQLAG